MFRSLLISSSVVAVLSATLYQLWLKDFMEILLGIGRDIQKIEEFPYSCQKISNARLQACEDLWLDDEARILYAACAGSEGRSNWNAAIDKLNVSGRRPGGTELIALDIDSPTSDGSFEMRAITPVGYVGAAGDVSTDYLGFDGEIIDKETIHFYLVNQRPPVDSEMKYIDATKIGTNSTIEVFEYKRGEDSMRHLRTVWSPDIYTPNNVAAIGGGAFVVTNDHTAGVTMRKHLDPILGGGSIAYCDAKSACHTATPGFKFRFPNGLARGTDGKIYLPSSIDGNIQVFSLLPDFTLKLDDVIHVGMPLDNLARDANGDFWIPGFPDGLQLMNWAKTPLELHLSGTIWKITRTDSGHGDLSYKVDKVFEDAESKIMNGVTTVRHDVKTGRLFLASVMKDLAFCEPTA